MHAGLFDVLENPGDYDALAVAQRINVDLERILEKAVQQNGVFR
jgi:hypothetical protein